MCGKGARVWHQTARLKLKLRLNTQQSPACLVVPIKAAPISGNNYQESGAPSQP
jgi:hypothetical protein